MTRAEAAAILGMHLEGPFISPHRLGAHPKLNLEPRGDPFDRVLAMSALRLLTLAPELPGALDAIRRLAARDVVISIGHTNATLDEANAGIAAGAQMFTHSVQRDASAESSRPRRHRRRTHACARHPRNHPRQRPRASLDSPSRCHARGIGRHHIVTDKVASPAQTTTRKKPSAARARRFATAPHASTTARSPAASSRCSTASA